MTYYYSSFIIFKDLQVEVEKVIHNLENRW